MLPVVHFLGLHIPMYTAMLVLGLVALYLLFLFHFHKVRRDDRITYHRLLFVLIVSVLSLALFALLFNSLFHSIEQGRFVLGGITWLGGVVGAIPTLLLFTHLLVPKRRGYAIDVLDAVMPGMALGHAFGRLGCFFGGCCFGRVTSSPLGVVFPAGSEAARLYPNAAGTGSLPVLPTQLFEAGFEVLLCAALLLLGRKTRRFHSAVWCISYGAFRFAAELLRGDDRGSVGVRISPAQLLSLLLILFGIALLLLRLGVAPNRLRQRISDWQREADSLPVVTLEEVIGKKSDAALLRELHDLHGQGVISDEEYQRKKAEILERM